MRVTNEMLKIKVEYLSRRLNCNLAFETDNVFNKWYSLVLFSPDDNSQHLLFGYNTYSKNDMFLLLVGMIQGLELKEMVK